MFELEDHGAGDTPRVPPQGLPAAAPAGILDMCSWDELAAAQRARLAVAPSDAINLWFMRNREPWLCATDQASLDVVHHELRRLDGELLRRIRKIQVQVQTTRKMPPAAVPVAMDRETAPSSTISAALLKECYGSSDGTRGRAARGAHLARASARVPRAPRARPARPLRAPRVHHAAQHAHLAPRTQPHAHGRRVELRLQ